MSTMKWSKVPSKKKNVDSSSSKLESMGFSNMEDLKSGRTVTVYWTPNPEYEAFELLGVDSLPLNVLKYFSSAMEHGISDSQTSYTIIGGAKPAYVQIFKWIMSCFGYQGLIPFPSVGFFKEARVLEAARALGIDLLTGQMDDRMVEAMEEYEIPIEDVKLVYQVFPPGHEIRRAAAWNIGALYMRWRLPYSGDYFAFLEENKEWDEDLSVVCSILGRDRTPAEMAVVAYKCLDMADFGLHGKEPAVAVKETMTYREFLGAMRAKYGWTMLVPRPSKDLWAWMRKER